MVVVLGGVDDPDKAGAAVADHFGEGPVVVGPVVPDLVHASISARAATAGLRAAPGWPDAPRPVTSDDLLPERALSGDGHARRQLVQEVYLPLAEAGVGHPRDGVGVPRPRRLDRGHRPGDVRARRTPSATGCGGPPSRPGSSPTDPRHAYTYRVALTLGRLAQPDSTTPPPCKRSL